MTKSNRYTKRIVLQKIRQRDFDRQNRRSKRQKKKENQYYEPREGLPVPRTIRRSVIKNPINSSIGKTNKLSPKKSFYINKYLPPNLKHLVTSKESPFTWRTLRNKNLKVTVS